ncbi:MAG: hypothetical protein EB059_03165 [Alphaproteobacteria bacterium]|nr:hypothetical protein [Alphaproteobacteria bacterium]
MAKKFPVKMASELTIEQACILFELPEPTLRARLRKLKNKYLNFKKIGTRYVIYRDELFEQRIDEDKSLPRRSPAASNKKLITRVEELEQRVDDLSKIINTIKALIEKRSR